MKKRGWSRAREAARRWKRRGEGFVKVCSSRKVDIEGSSEEGGCYFGRQEVGGQWAEGSFSDRSLFNIVISVYLVLKVILSGKNGLRSTSFLDGGGRVGRNHQERILVGTKRTRILFNVTAD